MSKDGRRSSGAGAGDPGRAGIAPAAARAGGAQRVEIGAGAGGIAEGASAPRRAEKSERRASETDAEAR